MTDLRIFKGDREPSRGNKQNSTSCLQFCCVAHLLTFQCQEPSGRRIEVHIGGRILLMKVSRLLTGLLISECQETPLCTYAMSCVSRLPKRTQK